MYLLRGKRKETHLGAISIHDDLLAFLDACYSRLAEVAKILPTIPRHTD